jgi:site-specific recombinase XerD
VLLSSAFNEFILQKQLAGLSAATIHDYKNIIGIFVAHIGSTTELDTLAYDDVATFILDLYKRPLSKATVATYIRNIRIFLRWYYSEYGMLFNPIKIKVPKTPKKVVHIYSDTELQCIFSALETSLPWITARNRAMIALMFDSGLRQSEVCTLLSSGIDRKRMILQVTGKGAKERLVPVGKLALSFLDEYLSMCPYTNSQYVFLDRLGKPVSTNAVKVFVNRLRHKLPFELTSHKLRHNFATNYCLDNIKATGNSNVYDLSILMGHESIETTKRYEHFAHEIIAIENRSSHLDKIYGM